MRTCTVIAIVAGFIALTGCATSAKSDAIAPPEELSPVGKKVWVLYAKAFSNRTYSRYVAALMDVPGQEEPTTPSMIRDVIKSLPALPAINRIVDFFSEAPREFEDDSEYWYERWVFWNSWGATRTNLRRASKERRGEIERLTEEKFTEIAGHYVPAAAVRAEKALVRSGEDDASLAEAVRLADSLSDLDPGNGYSLFLKLDLAVRQDDPSLARDYLHLAAQAPRFEYPATTAYKALIRHWVELHEEIPDGLMAYYFAHSSNAGIYWSGRFVKYLATEEGDDVQFMSDLPDLRKLVVRVGTGKPWGPPVQRLAMAVSLSRLHERALKAYVRAGNVDAIESKAPRLGCKLPQRILHKACDFAGWASSLDELLRVQTGKSWADTVSLSSYLRLSEFGLTDKWQRDIGNYMAEEYPPLYPEGNSAEPPAHTP